MKFTLMRKQADIRLPLTKSRFFLQIIVFVIPVLCFVQNVGAVEAKVLKLEQAIQLAVQNDSDVLVAKDNLEKAKLAVDLQKINNLPAATTVGKQTDNLDSGSGAQNCQVKIQQTLPTKWHLYGETEATDLETKRWAVEKNEKEYQIQKAQAAYDTVNLYYLALKAKKTLDYQQLAANYARAESQYDKKQLSSGKITKTTQLTAEYSLTKALYELEKDRQAYLLALKKLGNQLGITDYTSLILDETLLQQEPSKIAYEKLKSTATQERPEIKQYRIDLQTAEQTLAEAKNNSLPSVNLSYQHRGELQSYDAKYDLRSGDVTWSTAWEKDFTGDSGMENFNSDDMFGVDRKRISLNLSWTLDFGSKANQVKQADYGVQTAKRNLDQSSRNVALEIDEATSDYESAIAALSCNRQGIPLYQQSLNVKQLQSRMGLATPIDVQKAELDLASARTNIDTATCDLWIAAEKMKLVLGLLYETK